MSNANRQMHYMMPVEFKIVSEHIFSNVNTYVFDF